MKSMADRSPQSKNPLRRSTTRAASSYTLDGEARIVGRQARQNHTVSFGDLSSDRVYVRGSPKSCTHKTSH